MYIGFYCNTKQFNKNKLFADSSHLPIGDNLLYPFFYLAEQLKKLGHQVNTIDMDDIEKFDAVIFLDFPGVNNAYFKKLFTWQDEIVDNKKYFKIQYSHQIPAEFNFNIRQKEKLCPIISSNKSIVHPKELYTERIKAIRWFEANHPEDFNLYGNGWDRHHFEGTFLGIKIARLNRLKFLTKLLRPYYPSYKGGVVSKRATYQKYKFSICYENCKDFNGYITEKIFDCLLSGCVPVYLGAQNIADHIPKNVFIDKRNFNTYDQLYSYMKNMPDKEYQDYLDNIKNFLLNDKGYLFSTKHFANTLVKEILS